MALSDIKGFLFDLDGVFYVGDDLIPGALDVLDTLNERGLPHCFITNTTTQSSHSLANKLARLGIDTGTGQLLTAPVATRHYLIKHGLRNCHFVVNDDVLPDFAGLQHCDGQPDAVVIGDIGEAWSYSLLDTLFRQLVSGAQLVAMHRNRYWQKSDGLHLDIGAFVAGLEYAASTEAVITGKPSPAFFQAALATLGLDASEVAVVGDDVVSDVGGAQEAGLHGILVKTGKYRQSLVAQSGIVPDRVIESIADLVVLLR